MTSWDRAARLWDLSAKDSAVKSSLLRDHEDEVRAAAISPDNLWLVTGSEQASDPTKNDGSLR